MIPKTIIDRIFSAAMIQRWNDHVRPVELTEIDKQAHKAMIAFLLARFEEDRGKTIDWTSLIEGLIFDFFPRVVLTDIKAPFFHRLMLRRGPAINEHVIAEIAPALSAWQPAFAERFQSFLRTTGPQPTERRIIQAAHYLATQWEFKIVYHAGPFMYGIEETRREIECQLEDFIDLIGVQKINLKQKSYGFVDLCGQLRFQQRWAQTPRVPRTSVLGHSLFVAMLTYCMSLEINACPRRLKNNFLTALFHDLPEVLTRDISSPIKRCIQGLEDCIADEELFLVKEKLLPLLPEAWHPEIEYYAENPFDNRIRLDGEIQLVSHQELNEKYNHARFDASDGEIIRGCDELAAYIEASKSLEHGVTPPQLVEATRFFRERYQERITGRIHWNDYFAAFEMPLKPVSKDHS